MEGKPESLKNAWKGNWQLLWPIQLHGSFIPPTRLSPRALPLQGFYQFLDNLKNRLTLNAETPHLESKEETSFSLAKEVTTRARARLAPW